jgi:FMN phosphatase YigB (HAD superfamily)
MKTQLGGPVKHLLVDLDGTLLGNSRLKLSLDFMSRSVQLLKKYGGVKKATSVLLEIYKEFGRPSKIATNDLRIVELFSKRMNLSLEEGRQVLREGLMLIFPSLEKHFYPIPASKDFLEWAKDHYPLTLATNPVWPPYIVDMRVKWAGIDPSIFGFITHARHMHAVKPHPEYYEEILDTLKLKAKDCLLIGDDVKMDLPATRVGIRVFIVQDKNDKKTDKKLKTDEKKKTAASKKTSSKKSEGLSVIKTPEKHASAWTGHYSDLKILLQSQLSEDAAR